MESGPTFENQESVPLVETVRVALLYRGELLLLKKTDDSKNPGIFEFPGGKIDDIEGAQSTLEEQKADAIKEVSEETGIDISDLPLERVDDHKIYFEVPDGKGEVKKYHRLVHLFLVRIPDEQNLDIRVSKLTTDSGLSEDKHESYDWVSPQVLQNLATFLGEDNTDGAASYLLAKNSRSLKKLLSAIEASEK